VGNKKLGKEKKCIESRQLIGFNIKIGLTNKRAGYSSQVPIVKDMKIPCCFYELFTFWPQTVWLNAIDCYINASSAEQYN
jgi:hypothetical protein